MVKNRKSVRGAGRRVSNKDNLEENTIHHKIHHHVRLGAFFLSKISIALIAFVIGLFIGNFFNNPLISIFVACLIAVVIYVAGVFHLVKWMKL